MEFLFVTPVKNIVVENQWHGQLRDVVMYTPPNEFITEQMLGFFDFFGQSGVDSVSRNGICTTGGDIERAHRMLRTNDNLRVCHHYFNICQGCISSLWFIKDNAATIPRGYFLPGKREMAFDVFSDKYHSNAKGSYETITFTGSEVVEALKRHEVVLKYKGKKMSTIPEANDGEHTGMVGSLLNHGTEQPSRITRALLMLENARRESLLPLKISFYMSALECLFTSSDQQISRKLKVRTSNFIGVDQPEKDELFEFIGLTYAIRSKYFHGNPIPENYRGAPIDILTTSVQLDAVVRRVFNKALLHRPEVFHDGPTFDADVSELGN